MDNIEFDKSMFSNRVKIARNQKNLTQKQLGNELGVSRTTIANYENPNIDLLPSIENFFKLAHILDMSMDYLSGRTIDPSTKIENVGDVLIFIDNLSKTTGVVIIQENNKCNCSKEKK